MSVLPAGSSASPTDRPVATPAVDGTRKRVLLAAPRGYCAGVDRAGGAGEKALEPYGAPVNLRQEIG
ncbi:MAG: 4-hydroxy-3-methylbut-2-enyl diphosphate reductase, partial [Cellulosimicrobium funkei]